MGTSMGTSSPHALEVVPAAGILDPSDRPPGEATVDAGPHPPPSSTLGKTATHACPGVGRDYSCIMRWWSLILAILLAVSAINPRLRCSSCNVGTCDQPAKVATADGCDASCCGMPATPSPCHSPDERDCSHDGTLLLLDTSDPGCCRLTTSLEFSLTFGIERDLDRPIVPLLVHVGDALEGDLGGWREPPRWAATPAPSPPPQAVRRATICLWTV